MLPEADIYTHAWNSGSFDGNPFGGHEIYETFIAGLPGGRKHPQKYLPLMPAALARLDLEEYELLISSESGPAKGVRKNKHAVHLCYCHTPMRYLWDMYDLYYRNTSAAGKIAMKLFRRPLQRYDLRSAEGVDAFAANSCFVAERIKRIYGREATVINPPCEVEYFSAALHAYPEEWRREAPYLYVGELVNYKRADLAVEACRRMGRKLTVIGGGPQRRELTALAGGDKNIEFAGRLSGDELRKKFAECKALLFPGVEDFGIVPVEAQAAGAPVIAFGEGGALETVKDGVSGLFFHEASVEAVCNVIEEFEARSWNRELISERVRYYSAERFQREFAEFASDYADIRFKNVQ